MQDVKFIRYTVAVITNVRIILAKLTLGVIGLQQNVNAIYEYLRVLSSKQVNPLIIPPDVLRGALAHIKDDMKRNPRLQLPEDPNVNIWNYYPIMKITPVVMDDFLLIILTIPLTDQSLEMNLYKVYNLPALHPELKVEFTYELEGEYLAITKNKLYAALPTAREIRICKGTGGYLCLMNQTLYPIERIEWCIYALFTHNDEKKKEYCSINTRRRDANKAQSLEGYLWAITAFEKGKLQIRCLTDTHVIDIKPPLTIIYVGDGCEAYSNNLFIPAKSELTSTDSLLVRHNYFQKFNEEYQDITRYSLIEDLGIVQLTPKEIAKIPDRLTALPKLQFKELKRRLVEIKQPLNIHLNVSFISWLERIEAACLYAKRDPRQEALGHSGGKVLNSILSVPSHQPWKILKETLLRDYSEFKSPAHACTYLENMTQEDDESLCLYVYRYTRAHRMVTGLAPKENMDPSRWTHFLASINKTSYY